MEKFLGVLFCGGKGTRLGSITKYISKSFIPIYDRPVFLFGLELLKKSKKIDQILILTNNENNQKFKQLGYNTIIQNDDVVFDMLSGWEFVKNNTNSSANGVLIPSDNISDVSVDQLIDEFEMRNLDIVFSIHQNENKEKLSQMGTYDPINMKFYYKCNPPKSIFGVIAPYIVKNSIDTSKGDNLLGEVNTKAVKYSGFWYDIGDKESILLASEFVKNNVKRFK